MERQKRTRRCFNDYISTNKSQYAIPSQRHIESSVFAFHHHKQSMAVCGWPEQLLRALENIF